MITRQLEIAHQLLELGTGLAEDYNNKDVAAEIIKLANELINAPIPLKTVTGPLTNDQLPDCETGVTTKPKEK